MIVGTALELTDSPEGEGTLTSVKLVRRWRVQTDDYKDGVIIVTRATNIPPLYAPYVFGNENHRYALLRRLTAKRVQPNSLFWVVTGYYETPNEHNRPHGEKHEANTQNDNPLLAIPEIAFTAEKYQETIYWILNPPDGQFQPVTVLNGQLLTLAPAKASNGQVFDPPPTKDATRYKLTITRNEDITLGVHPFLGYQFQDTLNADVFWSAPARTVKCESIVANRQTKQMSDGSQFAYLRVTYKFEFRVFWDKYILDAGAFYLDANGNKVKFKTDDGHPRIGALNGKGGKLPDGAPPVFMVLQTYFTQAFAPLNLPQDFNSIA